MCDTLCSIQPGRAVFAKNSDRPLAEVQVIEAFGPRPGGDLLRTQYLSIPDTGAAAVLGARPDWLWGFEHGLNEHGVAIGNERVFTVDDASAAPPALIGMDLVRLGLERGRTADDALDVMTALLAEHGQGGIADIVDQDTYFSSFLIADPTGGWVLETSGRRWAARPIRNAAAISNRIGLGTDWTRSSPDLRPGDDWDLVRDPSLHPGMADARLAVTEACIADADPTPAAVARALRDHGGRRGLPDPQSDGEGRGWTVCMHLRQFQATTSSMIAVLDQDRSAPARAWVAMGSPCVSVYVPVFPPAHVPPALGHAATYHRFAALRDRVEVDPWDADRSDAALADIRVVLDPLEAALWQEADEVAEHPDRRHAFVDTAWARVEAALTTLGV